MPKIDFPSVFIELLAPYAETGTLCDPQLLYADNRLSSASETARKNNLKNFISDNLDYALTVEGVLPKPDSIIACAQREMGEIICEANVVAANRKCSEIVQRITAPASKRFVANALGQQVSGGQLQISLDDLIRFLAEDYDRYRVAAGNGLMSVAGNLNERLLVWCLKDKDLREGIDFTVTGKKSDGDIVVHSQAGSKKNLGVEIKSYHARERLLRGLQDVQQPKAGAGFFIDSDEFNENRTPDLLATNSAAIYLPKGTLDAIHPNARAMTTNEKIALGQPLYRPLERFASDMKHYCEHGNLPSLN